MVLRYEAWSLPWDAGGFKRRVATLPVPEGSGRGSRVFLSTSEDGSIDLNADQFARVGDVISDTVGSLIRVFDGSTVIHEWMAERNSRTTDDQNRNLGISGPGIKAAFDKAFIYPFDYPITPTKQPNHVWAGEQTLSDPGFEEGRIENETYEIFLDGATGGSFTLTVGGATTNPIAFDASEATVEAELEALNGTPDVVEVLVSDKSDGYQIEFVTPSILDTNMTWTPSLTGAGGDQALRVLQEGRDDVPAFWTKSANPASNANPSFHGTYASDGFRLTEAPDPVRSGTHSLRVNGLSQFAGAQQIVNVEPGARYQASVWVWSSDATETFRLVIRDRHGQFIAWHNITNSTPSTWTELSIDFETKLPDGTPVDTIIFRIAQTKDHNPNPFYIDDASLRYGAPAATPGEIVISVFDDAVVDHAADPRGIALDWVDYSAISTVNDSSGVPWTATHSFEAQLGESYGQVMDKLVDLGYEWDLIPKATPSGGKTHDLVVYNEGNLDANPSTAITIRQGVVGGEVVKRIPAYTAVFVEGSDGLYVEAEDATAITNFGRVEKYFAARHLSDTTSLTQFANQLLASESANRTAVQFEIVDTGRHPVPLRTYTLGDTLPMQMPPMLSKEERRVQRIDYVNTYPTSYVVTGSRIMPGEAAAFDLVRRLWRRFDRPRTPLRKGVSAFQGQSLGGAPTVIVAAYDASDRSKAMAHYICTGVNDQLTIQQAIFDHIPSSPHQGLRLLLTEGTFNINMSIEGFEAIRLDYGTIQGMGREATILNVTDDPPTDDQPVLYIALGGRSIVRDLSIQGGNGTKRVFGIIPFGDDFLVENVLFTHYGYALEGGGYFGTVRECLVESDWGINVVGTLGILNCYLAPFVGPPIEIRAAVSFCRFTNNVVECADSFITELPDSQGGIGVHLIDSVISHNTVNFVGTPGPTAPPLIDLSDSYHTRLVIADNILSGGAGIRIGNPAEVSPVANHVISDNVIISDADGIYLARSDRSLITDNAIEADREGIILDDCDRVSVHDNTISGFGAVTNNTYDGIRVLNDSNRNRIRDNTLVGATGANKARYGVNIAAADCDFNRVTGNDFGLSSEYATSPINDSGTGTILHENIIDDAIGASSGVSGSNLSQFSHGGTLSVGTGTFKLPFTINAEIISVQAAVGTSPTGADLIIDVNKNGTTIFTTQANRPKVLAGDADGVGAEATPDVTSVSEGEYLTVDIDQIGSTVAGSDLVVSIEWRPA